MHSGNTVALYGIAQSLPYLITQSGKNSLILVIDNVLDQLQLGYVTNSGNLHPFR